ncbi:MAG TPA: nicotinate phosphoribosyltransferase [Gammaproteobacteria bacterium]|nr:nicotinate phosphoribosyltransferase [Gammaproteobacteria bacterium]
MNRKQHQKPVTQVNMALFTDLYELTMLQAYYDEGMTDDAVFSLFVRRLPAHRNYLLACGLDSVLEYLENLHFTDEDIEYLESQEKFSQGFLDRLRAFRFTGDVHAVPEGTPVFANEPILEVKAPIPEAQIAETMIMNQVHLQTVLASKAARIVAAAEGRPVVDFGARRMHGTDAALKAARAFYIAGVDSTSNVLAGKIYGVPISGTMAHSYIQAHDDETAALRTFADVYPGTVLLVDTYDTLDGVRKVIDLVKNSNAEVSAVRLDSGNLAQLARETRKLLDESGLEDIKILVSGGLDETEIGAMVFDNDPVDGFGVGTHMGVSSDAPDLDIAYKLCEYAGTGRLKLSANKPILPGRKQVYRVAKDDHAVKDIIASADEEAEGRPLLVPVMRDGERLPEGMTDIESARAHAQQEIARLPEYLRGIAVADPPYTVEVSTTLARYQESISKEVANRR